MENGADKSAVRQQEEEMKDVEAGDGAHGTAILPDKEGPGGAGEGSLHQVSLPRR